MPTGAAYNPDTSSSKFDSGWFSYQMWGMAAALRRESLLDL